MAIDMLHAGFEKSAVLFPESTAIVFHDKQITYKELDLKAQALSKTLNTQAPNEKIIGLSTTRSIDMIIGMIAILKSGKAYMPIDPDYPLERQKYMVEISKVNYVLGNDNESLHWQNLGLTKIGFDEVFNAQNGQTENAGEIAAILFTSGSTGQPKGVVLGHKGLFENIKHQIEGPYFGNGLKSLQFTHIGFDYAIIEIFGTLISGGELHLIEGVDRLDSFHLLNYIKENKINRIFLPYVALQNFVEEANLTGIYPDHFMEIVTGGELLKITQNFRDFYSKMPNCILKNVYGPTETSICVTEFVLEGNPETWDEIPPIGKEIAGSELWILDSDMKKVPEGEIGELYIEGDCLAFGYINREDLTNEKFFKWKNPSGEEITLYKAGDLILRDKEGFYHFKGRQDDQVKVRGNRIEIGEVELALSKIEGVRQSVVKLDLDASGQKFLCGYFLLAKNVGLNPSLIKENLKKSLPDFMIPEFLIEVEEFPKTSTGKINKLALPKPINTRSVWAEPILAPSGEIQKNILRVFSEVLNYDELSITDNFFEFGGTSIKAQQTVSKLRQKFNYQIPITKLYQYPTIKLLSEFLGDGPKTTFVSNKLHISKKYDTDVAVIGINLNFPGAKNTGEFLSLLRNGKETIRFFEKHELDHSISEKMRNMTNFVAARGILDDFDEFDSAFFGINSKLASIADPQLRKFMEVCYGVLELAGYRSSDSDEIIGVFAGCSLNSYYHHNLKSHTDFLESFGDFQVMSLNEKDFIASRTAYHLDLKGPAVSVHSACSTSLLAVVQAVESIRSGKCTMALAGGSSIKSPVYSGHLFDDGSINSKDGHVNSFDINASGTVFSDGVGAVLLKRLDLAIKDGDEILAVVKGTGVNNDGAGKGSFSGPSAVGQSEAIAQAIYDANIDPMEIGYLEAHATATPIGDPIELDGLKIAFGKTPKNQYCAIGTVKANLGHLNAASGIAGFIKAVLSIKHKEFFPQINFSESNPAIDFEESPFYVNTQLKKWETDNKRIAGVSSFGVGGTNVHVILEEYSHKENLENGLNQSAKPAYLIPWSAKSSESLELYAEKLRAHFLISREDCLSDIAYSLMNFRPEYPRRTFVVATDGEDLIKKLSQKNIIGRERKSNIDSVFMFPGQGAQYLQMGKDLYESNLVFHNALNECAAILESELDIPLLEIIFSTKDPEEAQTILKNTKYTQPCIFSVEYAMARVWMSLGIAPSAMCGHSIGEFVAAHLAGIFSLKDGLRLVAKRGKLVSTLPEGSMVSVRCTEEQLDQLLPQNLSLAGLNGSNQCVVAGEDHHIGAFIEVLIAKEIPNKLLKTSHAFHSHMMDPILDDFKRILEGVQLNTPKIPILSTVTGDFLKDDEATSISYWTNQLRNPVRFFDAANKLFELEGEHVFLEVGPGNVLTSLCRQSPNSKGTVLLNSMVNTDKQTEYVQFLQTLGDLWATGLSIKWEILFEHKSKKVNLPTYAFKKEKIWLDPIIADNKAGESRNFQKHFQNESFFKSQTINNMNNVDRKPKVREQLVKIIQDTTGFEVPNENTSFLDLGFDSLLLTQLSASLKRKFEVSITFRQLNESLSDIDSLVDHLDNELPKEEFQVQIQISDNMTEKPVQQESGNGIEPRIPSFQSNGRGNHDHLGLISMQLELLSQQIRLLYGANSQMATGEDGKIVSLERSEITKDDHGRQKASGNPPPNAPKPFGAMAKIEKVSTELSPTQKQFIEDLIRRFNKKTRGSKEYTQKHRSFMADPRVVSGFKPATKEITYSIVVNKSKGNKLWDIDGNEYLDALNGFGSILLGHNPDFIKEAILKQLEKGYEIGPQHELSGEVCELVCELTGHERVALCNTGSEAVMGAVRMARTVTGRSLMVSFTGSYHGIFDEVLVRGLPNGKSYPAAAGIMPEAVSNILVLDYGSPESLEIIRSRKNEIAAILVEPVQSRRPEFQPIEYLKELRNICDESGSALIFDEVITGFRMHLRGAQGLFGIKADIAAYGKVAGGGISIGIIAGNSRFMDALDGGQWQFGDESVPEIGVTYFAGTFVRHPLALASTKASLTYLKNDKGNLYKELNRKTEKIAGELDRIFDEYKLPFYVAHFGSLWKVKYHEELPYTELIFALLREKGIHIYDGFPCFLTTSYTEQDLDRVIISFREAIEELIQVGFYRSSGQIFPSKSNVVLAADKPPVFGAKLGKDKNGNPAWFIRDSDNPERFQRLSIEI